MFETVTRERKSCTWRKVFSLEWEGSAHLPRERGLHKPSKTESPGPGRRLLKKFGFLERRHIDAGMAPQPSGQGGGAALGCADDEEIGPFHAASLRTG